jgi:chromosome segregation ATPase
MNKRSSIALPKNRRIGSNRREGAVWFAAPVDGTTQPAQVVAMAADSPLSPRSPNAAASVDPLPVVRLEVRHGTDRPLSYEVSDAGFLIGSVAGCDLRLPGAALPPVLCLISRGVPAVRLRKLAPAQAVHVNGKPVSQAFLNHGDRIALGGAEVQVSIQGKQPAGPPTAKSVAAPSPTSAPWEAARNQLRQQAQQFRDQVARFEEERKTREIADTRRSQELDDRAAHLETRARQLETESQALEADRALWSGRREEIEQENRKLHARERGLASTLLDLEKREQAAEQVRAALAQNQEVLEKRTAEVDKRQREIDALRQELIENRKQFQEHYRERSDRLAGLREAVNRAARKVQEHKRQLDAALVQAAARQSDLDVRAVELQETQERLNEERRLLAASQEEQRKELADRLAEVQSREARLNDEQQALTASQAQHQADLLRLDRLQAAVEERQAQLEQRVQEIDRRSAQLQEDTSALEDQARQLDAWHTELTAEAEKIARQKAEQEASQAEVAKRAAAFEGQQAMLAALRTRLEKMREDLRRGEQQLTEQRVRQEEAEVELQQRAEEVQRLREELDGELQIRAQERSQFQERSALLDAAVAQLRQAQETLAGEEEQLRQRVLALDKTAAQQAEELGLLKARSGQLEEMKQRLDLDRQALQERALALAQSEQMREALQEQLRKRSEELASRQKALAEQARQHEAAAADLARRRDEIEQQRQQLEADLAGRRQELDSRVADIEARVAELDHARQELTQREEKLKRHIERLKEAGRTIGAGRKALGEEREQWQAKRQEEEAALVQARADFTAAQKDTLELQQQLPDLELRAQAAADKLAQAREQLRDHLAEIHAYARQSRDDLETMQSQVQAEAERVRLQELALHRARDEHRLAVAAFRQQMIAWQGQIAEMKQSLAHGETRLERRQARVEEQARQMDETSARLALQAELLEQQERSVAQRRGEVNRHLEDMREWYRFKLRELAGLEDRESRIENRESRIENPGSQNENGEENSPTSPAADPQSSILDPQSSILTLPAEIDPGDQQLGDLLRSLDLIDADTLAALLGEARRQRRSLRQILLAGGSVTLYQMALIEAGNLDGLVLGPVRVVDRLSVTPRETVYRVHDPRRPQEGGGYILLRLLSEAEAEDAVHPDEFRQRFAAAAAVRHPNIASTCEVLDIAGRPAVLQEWVTGLPSADWPALAAVPGVWYRLLSQTALGLHTAHLAGLVHGHLHPSLVLLTPEGIVKLCGFGEPPWLVTPPVMYAPETDVAADLLALGKIAASWIAAGAARRGGKAKPLPGLLQAILTRLAAEKPEERYPSGAALLEDLDRAGNEVPANGEAWERLLRHVRGNISGQAAYRQSA